jgi:hypothetical protein
MVINKASGHWLMEHLFGTRRIRSAMSHPTMLSCLQVIEITVKHVQNPSKQVLLIAIDTT